MDQFGFNQALEEIWKLIRRTNKYIDETGPWLLAREEARKPRLDTVMHNLAGALRGAGNSRAPMIIILSTVVGFRQLLWRVAAS